MGGKKIQKRRGPRIIKILPDSSWLISLLNPRDVHHAHVKSCFGMLQPYKPTFFLSTLVIMETMSGLIRNANHTAAQARKSLAKFTNSVSGYRPEKPIRLEQALEKYQYFAKTKIKGLTTVDFHIATDALLVGAKFLTSDKKLYKVVRKSHRETYLISDHVKSIPSDLPRLTLDVVNNRK